MRVTFLGSGDAFAGGGRFQACLHLDGGSEPLIIDCGATTLIALKRAGIEPASIGWVALTLRCKRIVITHMGAEMLAHLDDADLEAAADGAVITI